MWTWDKNQFLHQAALVKAWGAGSLPKELLKASELALNVASQGIPTADGFKKASSDSERIS